MKDDLKKELKDIAPWLMNIDKNEQAVNDLPKGYFDSFPGKMMDRIRLEEDNKNESTARIINLNGWKFVAAASALILISITFWIWTKAPASPSTPVSFAAISTEEMMDYLQEQSVDESLIVPLMDDATLMELDQDALQGYEDDIEDYLEQEIENAELDVQQLL